MVSAARFSSGAHQSFHRFPEIRQQRRVHQGGKLGQIRPGSAIQRAAHRSVEQRAAPHARLNDVHNKLRLPLKLPHFVERALAPAFASVRSPGNVQQFHAMQHAAALQIHFLTQIEIQRFLRGFRLESELFLQTFVSR